MSQETLTPSDAGAAIRHAFAQIAERYPDHLDTWPRMLGRDADHIADVLDPTKIRDDDYEYVTVHYTRTDEPEPILWSPMQTEIRDAVAAILNPVSMHEPSVDQSVRGIVSKMTHCKTAVPGIFITELEVRDSYLNETKTYWRIQKETFWDE